MFIALGTNAQGTAATVNLWPGNANGLTVWSDGRVGIGQSSSTAMLGILVPDTDNSTDLSAREQGAIDHFVVRNDGRVTSKNPMPASLFVVNGRIQSFADDGGLWLSGAADGFVGNNGSDIGFFSSTKSLLSAHPGLIYLRISDAQLGQLS